jgi:hypothetical protein
MTPSSVDAKVPKILRIAVVQAGKVVEERQLKRRETVTVGSAPKNTFVIANSVLPSSFPLFEMRGGIYHLRFTEQIEGKHGIGEGPLVDFKVLVSQGVVKKQSDAGYDLPLGEASKGKVVWGDVTLLFQFVTPPPEPARPMLPEAVRGGWWRTVDRLFFGILLCSLFVHFGLIAAVSGREVSEDVTLDEIPDRFAKLIIPDKPVTPPQPKVEKVAGADEKKADKKDAKKAPKKELTADEVAAKAAAHHAKLVQAVASKGILKLLGADTGSGGAIEDVLGSGGGNSDIATALAGAGGVSVAGADSIGSGGHKGGGSGKTAGIGDLATRGGGNVDVGRKGETRISASVSASAPEVESNTVDKDAVSRYVRSRQRAIQSCYEKQLKLNPKLKGKLSVRITIATSGKVSETEIDEDTLQSDEVTSCIKGIIRFWRFPFTPESDTPVQFSWNFVSSQ